MIFLSCCVCLSSDQHDLSHHLHRDMGIKWCVYSLRTCWLHGKSIHVSHKLVAGFTDMSLLKGLTGFIFYGYAIARDFNNGKKYVRNYYQNYRPDEIEGEPFLDLRSDAPIRRPE